MSSFLVEADSVLSENYVSGFFQKRATDARFENVKMNAFHPLESLTHATQMTFVLPPFLGPNAYIPDRLLLQVDCKLTMIPNATTRKGPNIPPNKTVAPVNNTLHTLFKSCRIWLGETLVTKNGENYAYKSYFLDVLSNDGPAKFSWLEGQMFYQDVFGRTLASQTVVGNSGFGSRMNRFKTPDQSKYHQGTVTMIGKLHSDLSSCETPIIPGLGMRIELSFSSDDFLIQIPKTDRDRYKLTIQRAVVFCPVAQLTPSVFRKMEEKLNREAVRLYLTRTEVTNKSIPPGCSIFTERLFPGCPLPSKLILAFLSTTNYIGTQDTNPFFFQRKFPLPDNFTADLNRRQSTTPLPGTTGTGSAGLLSNITNTLTGATVPPSTSSVPAGTEAEEPEEAGTGLLGGDEDSCFIEKISVTLNGDSVDGLETNPASYREDIANFIRLHYYMGFTQSRTGNSLTYESFMNGFFFVFFDLSTSAEATNEFIVPAVRQGNLHLQVKFAKNTPHEITLLLFAEYPTLLEINKHRQVSMSY